MRSEAEQEIAYYIVLTHEADHSGMLMGSESLREKAGDVLKVVAEKYCKKYIIIMEFGTRRTNPHWNILCTTVQDYKTTSPIKKKFVDAYYNKNSVARRSCTRLIGPERIRDKILYVHKEAARYCHAQNWFSDYYPDALHVESRAYTLAIEKQQQQYPTYNDRDQKRLEWLKEYIRTFNIVIHEIEDMGTLFTSMKANGHCFYKLAKEADKWFMELAESDEADYYIRGNIYNAKKKFEMNQD